jgi:spore coat protein U-like protein
MMKSNVLALACILVLGAGSAFAQGSAPATLLVSAIVNPTCTISTTALNFGTYYTTTATALQNTGTLKVNCTNGATTTVTMDQGQHPGTGSSSASPVRQMADGAGNFLAYTISASNTYSPVWDGVTGYTGYVGTGNNDVITVYGEILPGLPAPAGVYTDSVQVTIAF